MKLAPLATDLQLPLDACTQTFAWIGRKGSGKTYGSGKLAELLLQARIQVVILDTVGNWYGLRLSASGKSPGYDIPVFGGLRQDLPLLATAGEVVADVVIETGQSVILDVSQFNFSDRKRFAADFGARLWLRKKSQPSPAPLHLIIEECQLIVPQFVGKDETRMVHVYEEIVRLGRNYGIGVSMLTQRPQSVNKEVLTQAECIMAFQINGVPERKALKDWLTYEGGNVDLVNDLPGLEVGTCYLWSPQWLRTFKKITIAKKTTMDASATPKAGQVVKRAELSPLDVKAIEQRMAATIEQSKQDDPKHLRAELQRVRAAHAKEVMTLEVELDKAKSARTEPKTIEVPVITDGQVNNFTELVHSLKQELRDFAGALDEFGQTIAKVGQQRHVPTRHDTTGPVRTIAHPSPSMRIPSDVGTGGLRRMLIALAQRPQGLTVRQLGVRAGLSSKSGSFRTYLSKARTCQWIAGGAGTSLQITELGLEVLGSYAPLPVGRELLTYWRGELGNSGAARILETLASVHPGTMTAERLGSEVGMSHASGSFRTYLSKLRTLELIEGRQALKASAELFD